MYKMKITAACRVGCVRSNNEDMVLVHNQLLRSDAYQTELFPQSISRFAIAVADGMGGHNAGEVASEMVLSNLKFYMTDVPKGLQPEEYCQKMNDWLHSINHTVNSRGYADASKRDMGTTLVGILQYEGQYYFVNCGDSRLYRFRNGQLQQLSTDHSLNNAKGINRHSNIITNCIGAGVKNAYMDMVNITEDIQKDDTFLLCSDGLNDMMTDEEIATLLREGATANRLCEEAIDNGGFDNVSAVVIRVES
jgi:protein phosphatase